MLVSEDQEIQIDRQYAPIQFSSDYGPVQDRALNDYVNQVGLNMATRAHRSQIPYSFRVVNANYVNAYAFPGAASPARGEFFCRWRMKRNWLPCWAMNWAT